MRPPTVDEQILADCEQPGARSRIRRHAFLQYPFDCCLHQIVSVVAISSKASCEAPKLREQFEQDRAQILADCFAMLGQRLARRGYSRSRDKWEYRANPERRHMMGS
jgi:hypothetical protein